MHHTARAALRLDTSRAPTNTANVQGPQPARVPLVPKLYLGTHLFPKLRFAKLASVRSRYHINERRFAHFVTATVVSWLPVFTTAARCDILIQSFEYCRARKGLKIYAWVILDNHFHAIVAAPELSRVLADLKRHTAQQMLELLKTERCEWLINQFQYFRAAHKVDSTHQVWQEGSHPQAMVSEEIMLQKLEYLHNNPVKRGLVALPEHWRYSSAHEWCPGVTPLLRCDSWR